MANKSWIGNGAPATMDLWTVTLSGTVISQTYSITINGKSVSYVANGSATVTVILAGLATAWSASTVPEHLELTAAVLPSGGPYTSLTLTQGTAGKASIISVATGGAATFAITNTTPASGPNDFKNGQNWSGGVAPANSDTLTFDNGSADCKYGLSNTLTDVTILVQNGYTGKIGLPAVNTDSSSASYAEYRQTHLTLEGGTATIQNSSIQRCNLAFGANTAVVRILDSSAQRVDKSVPPVLINGGDSSSTLDITKGDVGIAFYQGQTATFPMIRMSYLKNANSDSKLVCGAGATLTTIIKNGGSLEVNSAVTTITQTSGGGTTTVNAGEVTTLYVQGGTAIYNSTGTLGTVTVSNGGVLEFDQDPRAKTVTNPIQIYGDKSSVKDNQKSVNFGVLSFVTNQTTMLNLFHGAGNTGSLT